MTTSAPIGQPIDRVDGRLKVTGGATYAYEYQDGGTPVYGVIVGATIAKGRIADIDTSAAERSPGVLMVMTHRNAPAQPAFGPRWVQNRFARARPVLADDRVRYYDEPVAFVVAETIEAAMEAGRTIAVRYEEDRARIDLEAYLGDAYTPEVINTGAATDTAKGDFDAAFANAAATVDSRYTVAYQHHHALEPHAALALWDGDALTLYTATQTIANTRAAVAATLQIPPENVRVVSSYVGGGFGGKLGVRPETLLAAFAARQLRRPVKATQTRHQVFANVGHRPANVQVVKVAAAADGRLLGLSHDVWTQTTPFEEYAEQTGLSTRSLYDAGALVTRHRMVELDMQSGEPVRAPGEAPGMLAVESAMDELAVTLGMDPIELRIRNEPMLDPMRQVPFSSRNLVACLREGAERFGWADRPTTPGSRRDGRTLIGYGVSAAIRSNYIGACAAHVRIDPDGRAVVRTDMTDIGTGTYTILTQIAAQTLGLPLEAVRVELGDSNFPRSPGSGGSWGAASSGTAVLDACRKLREQMAALVGTNEAQPPVIEAGVVRTGDRSESVADLLARIAPDGLEANGEVAAMTSNPNYRDFSQHAFGAHFAEVGVDMDTGEIRMRRMLGVFAAGKILNPKTARSQMIGGMIWGVGSALHEEAVMDPRFGHAVNGDFAEYHVPVHADIPWIDAHFLDEDDDKGNPLGIKGIGELGICGAGGSIANAVFNASGVRVRSFPITLDKVLIGMTAGT